MLCHGAINLEYAHTVLESHTEFVIAAIQFRERQEPIVCGFALAQILPHGMRGRTLYVHLICARGPNGTGTKLLTRIADLAREHQVTSVTLSALQSAKGFYKKHGFNHEFAVPITQEEVPMIRVVESRVQARARKQRQRRQAERIVALELQLAELKRKAPLAVCRIVDKLRARHSSSTL